MLKKKKVRFFWTDHLYRFILGDDLQEIWKFNNDRRISLKENNLFLALQNGPNFWK
jgi:hypothetical protein